MRTSNQSGTISQTRTALARQTSHTASHAAPSLLSSLGRTGFETHISLASWTVPDMLEQSDVLSRVDLMLASRGALMMIATKLSDQVEHLVNTYGIGLSSPVVVAVRV